MGEKFASKFGDNSCELLYNLLKILEIFHLLFKVVWTWHQQLAAANKISAALDFQMVDGCFVVLQKSSSFFVVLFS